MIWYPQYHIAKREAILDWKVGTCDQEHHTDYYYCLHSDYAQLLQWYWPSQSLWESIHMWNFLILLEYYCYSSLKCLMQVSIKSITLCVSVLYPWLVAPAPGLYRILVCCHMPTGDWSWQSTVQLITFSIYNLHPIWTPNLHWILVHYYKQSKSWVEWETAKKFPLKYCSMVSYDTVGHTTFHCWIITWYGQTNQFISQVHFICSVR